jgi:uroporphyrin-III C-methyltransferase/precorrin-2 dehydrogenase/sirohydrochlorin ferrochelatase/uroporphyrin-III C-methyltransferase
LTLYNVESIKQKQWKEWAETEDTLVFYMSGKNLTSLANHFLIHNVDLYKGLAVIQQATTPYQNTEVFSFASLSKNKLPEFAFVPTLIIVGSVVNLHEKYQWFKESKNSESYFDTHKTIYEHAI